MTRIIPNQESFIGFRTAIASGALVPTAAEVAGAIDLTDFVVSINASTTGNTVPIPSLSSLFESNISGTAAAQFTASMYRDDDEDTAWLTLPRGTNGFFIISRFGGTGTGGMPIDGNIVEVWPVQVTARAGDQMTSNTAQTFSLTCAVPAEPNEDAVVTG